MRSTTAPAMGKAQSATMPSAFARQLRPVDWTEKRCRPSKEAIVYAQRKRPYRDAPLSTGRRSSKDLSTGSFVHVQRTRRRAPQRQPSVGTQMVLATISRYCASRMGAQSTYLAPGSSCRPKQAENGGPTTKRSASAFRPSKGSPYGESPVKGDQTGLNLPVTPN
uniref:Uncharacterized protein n=1 Tax=Trichuris muris TaxID=70415 RepID=A0A5S6QPI7_TRIMR